MTFSVKGLLGSAVGIGAGFGLLAAVSFSAPASAGPMPVVASDLIAPVPLVSDVAFRANRRAAAPRAARSGRSARSTRVIRGRSALRGRSVLRNRRGNDRAAAVAIGAFAAVTAAAIASNRRQRSYQAYGYPVETYPAYGQGYSQSYGYAYPVEGYPVESYNYGVPAYSYGYPTAGVAYYGRPAVRRAWRAPRYVAPRYAGPRYAGPRAGFEGPRYVAPRQFAPRYAAPRYAAPQRGFGGQQRAFARPVAVQRGGAVNRGQGARRGFR